MQVCGTLILQADADPDGNAGESAAAKMRKEEIMKNETKERVQKLMEEAIAGGVIAGASILVRKDGEELHYAEAGFADVEEKKPIRRDTIFRLYSMSKPVTAAAAMILMDQGKLDLAAQVSEFLPGFADVQVEKDGVTTASRTPVTIKHLLNMTSGLTYGDEETACGRATQALIEECTEKLSTKEELSTCEIADRIGRVPLAFEPGTSWRYGLSADVLGAVIEKASGMPFGDFLKKYLFDPLDMKDTGFYVPEEKQGRLVTTYESLGDGTMIPYTGNHLGILYQMNRKPRFESGGAGLVSTIDDYSRFAQMLLDEGVYHGVRILSKRCVKLLTGGGLTSEQQKQMDNWIGLEGYTYGNLMRVMERPGRACMLVGEGEYGWDGWLGCYFANLPRERVTLLLMMQKRDAGTISMTRKIRNVVLAGIY